MSKDLGGSDKRLPWLTAKAWDAVTGGCPGSLQRPRMQWQEAALDHFKGPGFSDKRLPWVTARVFSAVGKKKECSEREVRECSYSWIIGFLPQGQQGTPEELKEKSRKARVSQQERQEKVGIGRWYRKSMFCQSPSPHRYQLKHRTVFCHYWSSNTVQFWSLEIKHYCLKHVKHVR